MYLHCHVHFVEGGAPPNVHHPAPSTAVREGDEGRVHPSFWDELPGVLKGKIGGRIAQFSPSPLAPSHDAVEAIRTSQALIRRVDHSVLSQQGTNGARRHHVVVDLLGRNDVDLEPVLSPEILEKLYVAGPVFTKPMVVAHGDFLHPDTLQEHVSHIFLGAELRKVHRERDDHEAVEAELFQHVGPLGDGRQERHVVAVDDGPRMGVERDEGARAGLVLRSALQVLNDRLVTSMDAVKSPDGYDRAVVVGNVIPANFALHTTRVSNVVKRSLLTALGDAPTGGER